VAQVGHPSSSANSALAQPRETAPIIDEVLQWQQALKLHHGAQLLNPRLAWRLSGRPDDPLVVALGGISAHRRVFDAQAPRAGWWHEVVGPGLLLDSERLRILGIDYLGGSGDSSSPQAGERFPSLSSYDQAAALRQLLDHLQIQRLRAIVGASYGGMVALAFAERYPERVEQLLVISAADRAHPMATAWRSVQRRIVRFALAQGHAGEGLQLARALAMATYRSPEEFAARFAQAPRQLAGEFVFPIEEYLFARGRDYAARHRAESFLCLSESIDLHAVDALVGRLSQGQLHEMSSPHGHDAFLKASHALREIFQPLYGVA
jgi:homoserine O-acetyltransferase